MVWWGGFCLRGVVVVVWVRGMRLRGEEVEVMGKIGARGEEVMAMVMVIGRRRKEGCKREFEYD